MTSRERVRRSVLFQGPDRVPVDLPEPYGSDFLLGVRADPDPNWRPRVSSATEWEDEFGCVWAKLDNDKTLGQVKIHPLSDYRLLADYRFPNFTLPSRYETPRRRIEEKGKDKFILASIPFSLIHRLEYLRGHESAWTDPYEHPDQLCLLLDRLADLAIDAIDQFALLGVDGIFSCDDWGLQDRPMVSPAVFREFWKPRYHRVYRHAHQKGLLTFLHSCGCIIDLLDDFIEAELNVIQMDQQDNMGVDALSRRFGGRLCFWCPVDIQSVMITGSIDDVRNHAKRLINAFGKYNGGFIGKWYPSPNAVNHSREKINAMAEAFIEYGRYEPQAQCP